VAKRPQSLVALSELAQCDSGGSEASAPASDEQRAPRRTRARASLCVWRDGNETPALREQQLREAAIWSTSA